MRFNPQNSIDVKTIWNYLGTFYNYINPSDKKIIETYWKALFNGLEGLHYNLYQVFLSNNLSKTPGIIEYGYNDINLIEKDFQKIYLESPKITKIESLIPYDYSGPKKTYCYAVTAYNEYGETPVLEKTFIYKASENLEYHNNVIHWDQIPGAEGYRIYGREEGNFGLLETVLAHDGGKYNDDGLKTVNHEHTVPSTNTALNGLILQLPIEEQVLSLPLLLNKSNGETLIENIDYTVFEKNFLYFNKGSLNKIGNLNKVNFFYQQLITLIPILTNFYLKSFGETKNPYLIVQNRFYHSYKKGYLSNTLNFVEKQKAYALHLTRLVGAVINRTLRGPTLKNLREVLSLFYNVPFAYEDGVIEEIYNKGNFKCIKMLNSDLIYEIPNTLTIIKNVGDTVKMFDLLCSGVNIHDYISNPTLVSQHTNSNEYYYSLICEVPNNIKNLNYYDKFTLETNDNYIKNLLFPQNLIVKKI